MAVRMAMTSTASILEPAPVEQIGAQQNDQHTRCHFQQRKQIVRHDIADATSATNPNNSTDLDGDEWLPVPTVAGEPSVGEQSAGQQSPRAYVTAQFDDRTCRFVKLDFQQRGGLVIDEIEILAAGPLQ